MAQGVRKGVGSGGNPIGASNGGFMQGYRCDYRLLREDVLEMPGTPLMTLDSYLVKSGPAD